MNTPEIIEAIVAATVRFPLLGEIRAEHLRELLKWELGHEAILDGFHQYAGHMAMACGPGRILHIMSGNTPHAGLQSLIRGLILKSHNFCKIPSEGLPEIAEFRDTLPDALKARIEISSDLPPTWLAESDAVIVFGNDETIAHFRKLTQSHQVFIPHGHKLSFGIIDDDPDYSSVSYAARDASLFDQQGCLSPHLFYVREKSALITKEYAARLASEMEKFNLHTRRSRISAPESSAITSLREDYEFQAANGSEARVWKSTSSTDWTVIYDPEPTFTVSCLNRVIFVKPLPLDLEAATAVARPFLSTISLWPATPERARGLATLGASRFCSVGRMQSPHFTWHQDGGQNLAPLVRWIDFEPPV